MRHVRGMDTLTQQIWIIKNNNIFFLVSVTTWMQYICILSGSYKDMKFCFVDIIRIMYGFKWIGYWDRLHVVDYRWTLICSMSQRKLPAWMANTGQHNSGKKNSLFVEIYYYFLHLFLL